MLLGNRSVSECFESAGEGGLRNQRTFNNAFDLGESSGNRKHLTCLTLLPQSNRPLERGRFLVERGCLLNALVVEVCNVKRVCAEET